MNSIELINASAGSGKTYCLAELVQERVEAGLAPDKLLATTFTKKAAAELRERLRLRLLKNGHGEKAQLLLDGFVGTVNSVCGRLLKEYALEAGLSPAIEVLPEEEGERLFSIAVADVVSRHEPHIEPLAMRLGHDGSGPKLYPQPDWQSEVRKIVELARANGMSAGDLRLFAKESWTSLRKLLPDPVNYDLDALLIAAVDTALDGFAQVVQPGGDSNKALEHLHRYHQNRTYGSSIPWADWVPLAKAAATKRDGVDLSAINTVAGKVMQHPGFHADMEAFISGIFECAAESLEEYERYKREHGLMDYVDQEEKVLKLALENESFRATMKERLDQVMVDEFQDTSPIQLALFLQLHALAGHSTWVGDPKQSIFAYRGSDPQLMEEAAKRVRLGETLEYSWRSRELLVALTNEVFTRAFHQTPPELITLKIHPTRKNKAAGGWVEQWQLISSKQELDPVCIAAGVRDILTRRAELKPSDISVLCRTNLQCTGIASALEGIGIRASVSHGQLLGTREIQLAMAGLRYVQDSHDTLALAEIVHLSPLHSARGTWLHDAIQSKEIMKTEWRTDPLIASLDSIRKGLHHRTPMEVLEMTIGALHLQRTISSWSRPALRLSNLDALRGACGKYCERCRTQGGAATLAGFITFLDETKPPQASGSGDDTVQVLTYHKAKGLEWPVVILTSLNDDLFNKSSALGINMVPASEFDPADPLRDRSIRFWPKWFFGNTRFSPFDDRISGSVEDQVAKETGLREAQRLLYVGLTRARDGLIFTIRKSVKQADVALGTRWLDTLTERDGAPVITWPTTAGAQTLHFENVGIPIHAYEYEEDSTPYTPESRNDRQFHLPRFDGTAEFLRSRISPSSLSSEPADDVLVEEFARLGDRIPLAANTDMRLLGNAIHSFLAADDFSAAHSRRQATAERLLRSWDVEASLTPDNLILMSDRLWSFIHGRWPNARIMKEWPVTLRMEGGVLMQGWVDLLVATEDVLYLIDHKSELDLAVDDRGKKFYAQMRAYKDALSGVGDRSNVELLIHAVIDGRITHLLAKY